MTLWQWQAWHDQEFLTCQLLQGWRHGFFTRGFWPQTPEQLTPILDARAMAQRVKQVHGNRVVSPADLAIAREDRPTGPWLEADALVSHAPGQALWVCSADCSPILIGDPVSGRVAAIHAGWRGTALRIGPHTVAQLQAQGSRIRDLVVAIGPAIAGSVYQVSEVVAAQVMATLEEGGVDPGADGLGALPGPQDSPLLPDPEPGKARLDVRLVNRWQFTRLGLDPEKIAIAPHCTFQEPQRFFSYRRTGERLVQWSGIVSGEDG